MKLSLFFRLLGAAFVGALMLAAPVSAATFAGVVHPGAGGVPLGVVFEKAGLSSVSITGSTSETVLGTVKIPANTLGANARVIVRTFWNFTGTAGTKTTKIYLNSVASTSGSPVTYLSAAGASGDLSGVYETFIWANNATNSQSGGLTTGANGRSTAAVLPTSAFDTTSDVYLVFTATLANSADTAALAAVQVEVLQ